MIDINREMDVIMWVEAPSYSEYLASRYHTFILSSTFDEGIWSTLIQGHHEVPSLAMVDGPIVLGWSIYCTFIIHDLDHHGIT